MFIAIYFGFFIYEVIILLIQKVKLAKPAFKSTKMRKSLNAVEFVNSS